MGINLHDNDYRSLESFELISRWTDEKTNVLPSAALAQIRPLTSGKAGEIYQATRCFFDHRLLAEEQFTHIVSFDDRHGTKPEVARLWLEANGANREEPVAVLWYDNLAVQTKWGLFCEYWDDFCYPFEPVLICPLARRRWVLYYHPEEILFFGMRENPPGIE